MAKARSSIGAVLICICLLLLQFQAESAEFTVGDGDGWTFNTVNWPNGKSFKAGDVLVFKYSPSIHNVVITNAGGYNSCNPGPGSKVLTSGNDRVTLARGTNYFICSFPGHCQADMKIAVNVA